MLCISQNKKMPCIEKYGHFPQLEMSEYPRLFFELK
jgi:hypothetical protein